MLPIRVTTHHCGMACTGMCDVTGICDVIGICGDMCDDMCEVIPLGN